MVAVCRPAEYHQRESREPWLLALRRLWARGYSDRRIAEALSDLSAERIAWLERYQLWQRDEIEDRLEPLASGLPWTKRQVCYYRGQVLGLPAHRDRSRGRPHSHEATRALGLGWGHLMPLTPTELQLVEDLARQGPGTRRQLESRTGLKLKRAGQPRATPLRRLLDRAIVVAQATLPVPIYTLASGITRRPWQVLARRQEAFLAGFADN